MDPSGDESERERTATEAQLELKASPIEATEAQPEIKASETKLPAAAPLGEAADSAGREEVAGQDVPADAPRGPKRKKKRPKIPDAAPEAEPFAAYLARLYIAEKGFRLGTATEAAALSDASDFVLTYADGMAYAVVCLVDAERNPTRVFELTQDRLIEIGRACLPHTGRVSGTKLPVGLLVVEVRDGIREEDKARLGRLRRTMPGLKKVSISAFMVSPRTGEVWSTLAFGWLQERWLRKALGGPRKTSAELTSAAPALPENPGAPWLTLGIIGLTVLFFLAENAFAVDPDTGFFKPSIATLIAMGGVSGDLVRLQGEWWRALTAVMLHADPIHLLLNGVGLFFGGAVLEAVFGRAWLAAIFVAGALGGSLASILVNDSNVVSVGASGAIMALLAAAFVSSYRVAPAQRAQVQMPLVRMLVPSLLPIVTSRSGEHVDFAAHFGGALVGVAAGVALLKAWPLASPLPPLRRAASVLAIAGAALCAYGFFRIEGAYAGYRDTASVELVPGDQLDSLKAENVTVLLAKYPRDPRVQWVAAMKSASENDLPGAEKRLRAALSEEGVLRTAFGDRVLEAGLRGMLARVLEREGRHAEALEAARPACDTGSKKLEGYCP